MAVRAVPRCRGMEMTNNHQPNYTTTDRARLPKVVTDRVEGEGTLIRAEGHVEDCWDGGCAECELHAFNCTCGPCNVLRKAHTGESLDDFLENQESDRIGARWKQVLEDAFGPDAESARIAKHTLPVTLSTSPKMPALLTRDDGETLLYEGVLNSLFGQPGMGKTWIAIMTAVEAVRAGARVAWWDFESSPATLATRLKALRAADLIGRPEIEFITPSLAQDPEDMPTQC